MPLADFYSTAAQLFFAILGFWWVVVQFKHQRWSHDPVRRRASYVISLHFLLPGVMSLVSLLSGELSFVWNVAFAIAGAFGVVATLLVAASGSPRMGMQYELFGQGAAIGLYALITLLALFPGLPAAIGLGVRPIVIEAILITLLTVLGVTLAWFLFMEPDQ